MKPNPTRQNRERALTDSFEAHMYMKDLPSHLTRALARPRLTAGVLVALALLSAACSNDSASRINAPPPLASSSSNSQSSSASGPSLGVASSFAILSAADGNGGAVTCVGPATITGNVGSSGVITPGACSIIGSQIAPVSAGVVAAFDKAYADLAGQQCTQTILTEAYTNQTLSVNSGVICFPTAVTFTNSTLTLTGNGPWLFKIGSGTAGTGALTGTNLNIVMPIGANPCDVTWWVRAGVTMTTNNVPSPTHFFGTILAGAAITVNGAVTGTFNGRALAKAGVSITGGTFTGCTGGIFGGKDNDKDKDKDHENCNQGVGNGREDCDPGNSNHRHGSNDEDGGSRGDPGRKGGH
jgi:Ice-binding-like